VSCAEGSGKGERDEGVRLVGSFVRGSEWCSLPDRWIWLWSTKKSCFHVDLYLAVCYVLPTI